MSRDAALLLSARVISALTTVVVLAIVARSADPAELGLVAVGLTVGLVLAVFSEAGLSALLIREVARAPDESGELLTTILITRVVALPLALAVAAAVLAVARPGDAGSILIVALGPAIQQVGELARSVFIARNRVLVASVHSIIENVGWMLAIAFGFLLGLGLNITFAAAAMLLIVVDVGGFLALGLMLHLRLRRPTTALATTLARQAGPFVAYATLIIVAARADTLLIFILLPNSLPIVGAYFAAARLLAAGEYVPDAIGRAILPELSRRFHSAPDTVAPVMSMVAGQTLALGILIPFGVILAGRWVFEVLYGAAMAPYGWLLVAMAGIVPFRYMSMFLGVALASIDAQLWRTIAVGVAVVFSLLVQVVLIPRIGATGAIAGTYVVWMITATLSFMATRRVVGPVLRWGDLLLPLAVGGVAFAIGQVVAGSGLSWAVPLAGAVYAAIAGTFLVGLVARSQRPSAFQARIGRPSWWRTRE